MGRRNRSKRSRWEEDEGDDDGLERAEMAWLNRHASKRQKSTSDDAPSTTADVKKSQPNDTTKLKKNGTSDESSSHPNHDNSPPDKDKIERMKLKKQRQKERRKEKKAQAANATAAAKQTRIESEKSLRNKQKLEREKKTKIKSKPTQQQFTTLSKGVQYQDLIVGKGPEVQHRKKVRVSYTLRSKSHTSGKILDSSNNFGFRLGKGEVISGWDVGLQNMRVGGVRRLIVPPAAGYGNKDVGAGRGADLYFVIELLHVAH